MPIIKTEAFVLKSFRYGESSRITTLFTREFGKISVIARGIRNHKSKMSGIIEMMNHISAVIYYKETRELQYVSSAELIHSYDLILKDIEKMSYAFRMIELVSKYLTNHDAADSPMFDLLVRSYSKLNAADRDFEVHLLYFLWDVSIIMGIFPAPDEFERSKETLFVKNEFGINETLYDSLSHASKYTMSDQKTSALEPENVSSLIKWFEKFISGNFNEQKMSRSAKVFAELI